MNRDFTEIPPPNYTQIPNVIFDYWMNVLSPGSFKVLICMCRKIFGWHKTSDTISKNQIMKATGMSKNTVQVAVEELEKHGLVLKFQNKNEYGQQPNTYALNVDKPKDSLYQDPNLPEVIQNLGGGRSEIDPGVGQNLTGGVGQNLTPQKKDLTKERLTKDKTPPTPLKGEEVGGSFSPKPVTPKKEKPDFSPEVRELGDRLIELMHRVKPDYVAPKNLTAYLTEIDFLLRLDKRDSHKVVDVFSWALADSFWADKLFKPNPAKYLREKFDQLDMKMNAKQSEPKKVDRRTRNMDGTPVDAPHLKDLF